MHYYEVLFLAMGSRSSWQFAFGLETQVRDHEPCLKQNLEEKLSKLQAEVRQSPHTSLSEALFIRDQPQAQPAVRHSKYDCVMLMLPPGWKPYTSHLPKKQTWHLHQDVK